MANELLNKLKLIDNSRKTLHGILGDKGVNVDIPSFPNLVNAVNDLHPADYEHIEWNGVPIQEEPEYWKPDCLEQAKQVLEDDTDKDNYDSVILLVMKADETNKQLPRDVINYATKLKYSDNDTLISARSNGNNNEYTFDTNKDINWNGEKYRYIIWYSNVHTNFDYNGEWVNPYMMLVYKGKFNNTIWFRDAYTTPAYIEIYENVQPYSTADAVYINAGSTGYAAPQLRTFISYSPYTCFSDGCFSNCMHLEFVKNNGTLANNTNGMDSTFRLCYSLKYVHLQYVSNIHAFTFFGVHNCYIQIDTIGDGTRIDSNACLGWRGDGPFTHTINCKIHIGTINGSVSAIAKTERDGIDYRCNNLELEIEKINGNLVDTPFYFDRVHAKGIKIGQIVGNICNDCFNGSTLSGSIIIGTDDDISSSYTIGERAFRECSNLTDVSIKKGYNRICNYAFAHCDRLHTLNIGDGVTTIDNYILENTPNVKTISIPDTVTSISQAFNLSFVESVSLGEGITTIVNNMFNETPTLKYIQLPSTLLSLGTRCFADTSITDIILPKQVTVIPDCCFQHSSVENITTLGDITNIGNNAFDGCTKLKSFDMSHVETVGTNAFIDTHNYHIHIPVTLKKYDINSFQQSDNLVTFDDGFELSANMVLTLTDYNSDTILDLLKCLPDMTGKVKYTITVSPTKSYLAWHADYNFYTIIKNKRINTQGDALTWDEETGDMTVEEYVTSKNIVLA